MESSLGDDMHRISVLEEVEGKVDIDMGVRVCIEDRTKAPLPGRKTGARTGTTMGSPWIMDRGSFLQDTDSMSESPSARAASTSRSTGAIMAASAG